MASFSVDITDVILAGAHSGYKDITIIGRPQAIIGSITGTDASSFGWRTIDGNDSALRVYSTATGTTSVKNAVFKITNASDASDYVEVQLHQLKSGYVDLNGNTRGCVFDVISDDTNTMINAKKDLSSSNDSFTYVFFNQNNGGYSTAHCTVLLDGSWTIPTGTNVPSWISLTSDLGYTDTGFKKVYIACVNNYDGPRQYMLNFNNADWYFDYVWVMQDGYPGTTSGCTETLSFSKNGGTLTATLKHPSISSSYYPGVNGPEFYHIYGSGYSTSRVSKTTNESTFSITVPANTTGEEIRTFVYYYNFVNDIIVGLGHTIIIQAGDAPTPTLTVDPSVLTYPSSGGARVMDVTYATSLSTNISSFPSWLSGTYVSVAQGSGQYTITAASNASIASRSFNFELADANMSLAVPITQAAGQASSLSISPSSNSVTNSSGSVQITVTAVGISEINYSSTSWITYSGKSGSVYTFSYTANTTTSQRTGTITFYGGGLSETYTLIQAAGEAPSLVVSPTSDSVGASSGTYQVTVTPTNISSVSYSISDNWLSYSSKVGNVYTFSYTANATSAQRQSVVTFTGDGISRTFTLTQAAGSVASLTVSPATQSAFNTSGTVSCTVTASGGTGSVSYSISDNWLTFSNTSGSNYYFNFTANATTSSRTSIVTFTYSGITRTFTVTQEAGSSSIVPNPAYLSLNSAAQSNLSIAVTYSGGVFLTSDTPAWITDLQYSGSGSSGVRTYYFGAAQNTLSYGRVWYMHLYNDNDSVYVPIVQSGSDSPSITINPTIDNVSGSSGSVTIVVDHPGINQTDMRAVISDTSWITSNGYSDSYYMGSYYQKRTYYFNYSANTGTSQRSATIEFSGLLRRATYTLTQDAGSTAPVITVSPTSSSVGSSSGTTSVSATATGGITVNYNISGSWLSYVSVNNGVYTFSYTANTGSSSRTATVTFSGTGATSKTFTLTQAGTSPGPVPVETKTLQAHPSSLRFYKESSSKTVSFTNRPTAGISYSITYTDGSGWLSVSGSGKSRTATATANTGIRRRATIRFYETGNSSNYVDVPVIQGSVDGYDSIWMDQLFYPQDRDADNNYFYRVANVGFADMFVGISTIPPGWGGNVGGIDIPRLVEGSIVSYLMTNPGFYSGDWADMYESYCTTEVYNMTQNGYPGTLDATFKYWNDWSRTERRYDYTRTLNDPINGKGREDMFLPFCIYYDDAATFSIEETETNGNVNTYTFSTPEAPFVMRYDKFYDTKKLVYKQDNQVLFTYDMTHCGPGAFIYRNRYGGWDSFLIEGNVSMTDNYSKLNFRTKGDYNGSYVLNTYGYFVDEKHTEDVNINQTFEAHTGWLSDEESERLAFHLLSSPIVYFQDFNKVDDKYDTDPKIGLVPVRLTNSSTEYKKFRNGKRLVNYTITFEKCSTEKVKY